MAKRGAAYCAAAWCGNFSGCRVDERLSFFRFPKDTSKAKEWAKFCLREDLLSRPGSLNDYRVCSEHFKEEDYRTWYPRRLLRTGATPSVTDSPLIESHPSEKNGIPLCEEVCRLADEKAEEDSNLEKTKKRRVIGYRCESAGNTCKRPMLYGEQPGKHNIDTQEADFELTLTELKEEQEDLTTGELIELDEHSSDGSRLQASSKFYSSLFGDIPAECVVDCILTESAHSTSADGITGVSPINAATCDNAIVPTEVPVVKLGHPSATTSVECPSASKNISFTSQNVPNEFPCHEDTILSIPDSSGSSHSAKVEVSKEATVMGTAEASPQGVEGGTELVASDPQEDSASDQDSVFSIEAPPSPSHRLTRAEKVVDGAVVEMMARSFFASSGSESLVFLTDPYYKYKLCRLCFTSGRRLTYIFGGDFKEFDLKGAVEDLLHFRVSKSDDYPQHICDHCLPKLVKFKRFKDQFLKEKELFDEELKKHNKRIDKGDTFPSQAVTQGDPIPESISNLPEDLSHLSVQREEVCETFLDSTEATTDVAAAIALDQKPESHNDQTASKEATSNDDNISLQGDFDDDCEMDCSVNEGYVDFPRLPLPAPLKPIYRVQKAKVEGIIRCTLCGQVFQYKNHRDDHMKEHEKTFPFPCTDCDRRFQTLMNLNAHVVRHSDYRPYQCEVCGKQFHCQAGLKSHKETHSEGNKYLCSDCGKGFKEYSSLLRHMNSHQERKMYICNVCQQKFSHGYNLKRHLETHASEKPFVCELCGKTFASLCRMKRHKTRQHPVEKDSSCDVCGKVFRLRHSMMEHRRWHFKQRPVRIRKRPNKECLI